MKGRDPVWANRGFEGIAGIKDHWGITMERISGVISKVCYYLGGLAMFLLCVVMVVEVIFRYIPGLSMAHPWIPGVLIMLDTWLIFLGSVVAMERASHLRITFFVNKIQPTLREWNSLLVNILTLLIFIIILIYSKQIIETGMDLNYGGIPFSKGYTFLALPVCVGLMTFQVLLRISASIKRLRKGGADV